MNRGEKGIRNLFELHNPNPEAKYVTPPPRDLDDPGIQFPGGDEFNPYGEEYELDLGDIYDTVPDDKNEDSEDTLGGQNSEEKNTTEKENSFVATVKPGLAYDHENEGDESDFFTSGLNIPIYLIILVCIGLGLLLWIAAWIGWSCRKCCQARVSKICSILSMVNFMSVLPFLSFLFVSKKKFCHSAT